MAARLLSLPWSLGIHPTHGGEISLHLGRFGPYVALHPLPLADGGSVGVDANSLAEEAKPYLCSLPKRVDMWTADAAIAAELIDGKMQRDVKRQAKAAEATAQANAKANTKPVGKADGKGKVAAGTRKAATGKKAAAGTKAKATVQALK